MVEIRAFDGDLQEVSELIKSSWGEDYQGIYKQPVMDYSNIDFLEWNLKKPNAEPLNLLGAYKGKKLVGFLGTFAVSFRYNDISTVIGVPCASEPLTIRTWLPFRR